MLFTDCPHWPVCRLPHPGVGALFCCFSDGRLYVSSATTRSHQHAGAPRLLALTAPAFPAQARTASMAETSQEACLGTIAMEFGVVHAGHVQHAGAFFLVHRASRMHT